MEVTSQVPPSGPHCSLAIPVSLKHALPQSTQINCSESLRLLPYEELLSDWSESVQRVLGSK